MAVLQPCLTHKLDEYELPTTGTLNKDDAIDYLKQMMVVRRMETVCWQLPAPPLLLWLPDDRRWWAGRRASCVCKRGGARERQRKTRTATARGRGEKERK